MNQFTPLRDAAGNIIGMKTKGETDPVQQVLDASMQAVGAIPEVQPPVSAPAKRPLPPTPSFRLEIVVAVICLVVVGWTFLPRRTVAPTPISRPPTVAPTRTPRPTVIPTTIMPINPRAVTLSTGLLYGDYDEDARIGTAPEGVTCMLSGQSPDGLWAYLACPAPTGQVWARVADLELSADQRSSLMDTRIISRIVPTVPAFSPPSAPQGVGSSLAFCADRDSIWGRTHQCAATQSAADALADGEMGRINATAEAMHNKP
jgi:hypothetical protein